MGSIESADGGSGRIERIVECNRCGEVNDDVCEDIVLDNDAVGDNPPCTTRTSHEEGGNSGGGSDPHLVWEASAGMKEYIDLATLD